jgi:acyl carrier protein phosphodiesterase
MNYLTHLSLAYPDPELITGNFIADLIGKKDEATLNPIFKRGVLHHRWIDHFSNNHITLSEMNKMFHPYIHKYAPVGTDIICDHLLTILWHKYFEINFEAFAAYNYSILESAAAFMPKQVKPICINMIQHQWLNQYLSMEGLNEVLQRTSKKTSFKVNLALILPLVEEHKVKLLELFREFYEDCSKQSKVWISLQNEETA